MQMLLTLVRHAQSEYNIIPVKTTDSGLVDCAITPAGVLECAILNDKLKNEKFDVVLCSPLLRAKQTLAALPCLKDTKVVTLDLCREYKQDSCDFLVDEKVVYETKEELIRRINNLKAHLLKEYSGQKVILITHADLIHEMCDPYNDESEYWLENATHVSYTLSIG